MGRRELAAHLPRKAAIGPIADANARASLMKTTNAHQVSAGMVAINAEVATEPCSGGHTTARR
jgi:hypothetical protein